MTQPMTPRSKFLGGALALSLAATGWLSARENGAVEVAEAVPSSRPAQALKPDAPPAGSAATPDLQLERLLRREAGQGITDLFAAKTWQAPAPQLKSEPVAAPSAPPLPFVYLGKMAYEGDVTVFVARQDSNYAVHEGDVLDGTYKVDAIKGSLMTLIYLPLNIKQTMHIGDQN
jgi:hypothetical protein